MPHHRVHLVHWNAAEAVQRAKALRAVGRTVEHGPFTPESSKALRDDPPDAFVIDLTRLPSHGRQVGMVLRQSKRTRHVPLVFVGGDPAKVARVKELLPDAAYSEWPRIRSALRAALARGVEAPVVPVSTSGPYSGTPLPKKLGMRDGSTLALVGAPARFEKTLGELPAGARVHRGAGARDLTLWFARSRAEIEAGLDGMAAYVERGGLWIAWPKKASGVASDLDELWIRKAAIAKGLVDFKVCAIDGTWSGLRFGRSRAKATSR